MLPREELKRVLILLQDNFPEAFPRKGFVILKKGIDLDICKSDIVNINRTTLRTVLRIYTNYPGYIDAHVVGARRYDLKGKVVGQVTEDEYKSFAKFQETRLQQKKFLKKAKASEGSKIISDKNDAVEQQHEALDNKSSLTNDQAELKGKAEATVVVRKKRRPLSKGTTG